MLPDRRNDQQLRAAAGLEPVRRSPTVRVPRMVLCRFLGLVKLKTAAAAVGRFTKKSTRQRKPASGSRVVRSKKLAGP